MALWAAVALVVWADAETRPGTIEVQGAFLQFIVAAVGAAFKWLADKAVTIGLIIYHATVIVGRALLDFGKAIVPFFRKGWHFLQVFWSSALKPFVQWAWKELLRFQGWLTHTFKPVLEFLLKTREAILTVYRKWVAPIFDTITVVRRILDLLASLHVPFARQLDAKLAALEHKLLQPLNVALGKINELINWVNRIVDLNGLFQRVTLIQSIARDVGRIGAVWHAAHTKPLTDDERKVDPTLPPTKTPESSVIDFRVFLRTGDGPHRASLDEAWADLRLRLKNV